MPAEAPEARALVVKVADRLANVRRSVADQNRRLIEMYRRTKNIDAIKSVYADLFKLDPKNHGHRIDLAKLLIGFRKKADAEQVQGQQING